MTSVVELGLTFYVLILVRTTAFLAALPHFGGPSVPRTVKAGLIFALTNYWFITLGGTTPENLWQVSALSHWLSFVLAVISEALIGLVLGYTFDLFLTPFRVAGEFIGQEMGLTLGTILNPTLGRQNSAMGQVFDMIGAIAFFSLDLHHVFFASFHGLFWRRPIGGVFEPPPMQMMIHSVNMAEEWGLQLAAPVIACLFITSIVMALMARAAPQLNLMNFGYALRVIVGLVAIFWLLPEMSPAMKNLFQRFTGLVYSLV